VPDENKSRLGRQLGLGAPGMARRFGADDELSADRQERARAVLREAVAEGRLTQAKPNQLLVPGPSLPEMMPEAFKEAAVAPEVKGRGRPKVEGERPWGAAGMSRRTWYRRKGGTGQ
jgi:hypothetical protein